uniref:Putative secreted protein n=1 Tax=Amblyomma cajennense TaxID=34607 RepID=A0A023FD28_AMBCJ
MLRCFRALTCLSRAVTKNCGSALLREWNYMHCKGTNVVSVTYNTLVVTLMQFELRGIQISSMEHAETFFRFTTDFIT